MGLTQVVSYYSTALTAGALCVSVVKGAALCCTRGSLLHWQAPERGMSLRSGPGREPFDSKPAYLNPFMPKFSVMGVIRMPWK